MSDQLKELSRPEGVESAAKAQEFVRFWIADNKEHVNVLVGTAGDPEKEPAMWGFILADIAKHVTKAMREKSPDGPAAQDIMEQILGGIAERLKHAPELSGSAREVKS